jgi:hypothetical protein
LIATVPEYWWPFLYQYGVGLIVFMIGLALILGYRSCNLTRRADRLWFAVLILGLLWYAGLHFLWYMAALYVMPGPAGGAT